MELITCMSASCLIQKCPTAKYGCSHQYLYRNRYSLCWAIKKLPTQMHTSTLYGALNTFEDEKDDHDHNSDDNDDDDDDDDEVVALP